MEHTIDAANQRLGRVATKVATLLQDKHKASYEPNRTGSTRVVVKNAGQISVSGSKDVQKMYYRHTGYMGHLRELTFKQKFEKSPEKLLFDTIRKMLPVNRLRRSRLARLSIQK